MMNLMIETIKLNSLTDNILRVARVDIPIEYSNCYSYEYENQIITLPKKIRLSEGERFHIIYLKHYDLDLYKLSREKGLQMEMLYHVVSLLHEIGHHLTSSIYDYYEQREEYEKVKLQILFGGDLALYRQLPLEQKADMKATQIFLSNKNRIIKLLKGVVEYDE